MGYDFRSIPSLTWAEVNTLLLGYAVNEEAEADAEAAAWSGQTSDTERRKREHQQNIRRRLIQN